MTSLYALLYLEINLVSVLLVLFIRFRTLGLSKMVSQRNFSLAIDSEVIFFLSDTVAVLLRCGLLTFSTTALMLAKSVYFFSTVLMCFSWFLYFEHLQGSPFVVSRRAVRLNAVLVYVMAALLIVNWRTGILFYVEPDGSYHRGPLFVVQYLLAYVYIFAACGHAAVGAIRNEKPSQRGMLISLALFPLAPGGSGILQFIYPELPLACVALSFATLVMYLNWLDEMISLDPLTHLNNRKQLMHYYELCQHSIDPTPLYLLLIDANKFKSINDTYGHSQGDAALERIAQALRQACKGMSRRPNIARYGGDEFVILARSERFDDIVQLKARIAYCLNSLNKSANAPYELTVSVGITQASPDKELKALIAEADQVLYAEKARLRKQR